MSSVLYMKVPWGVCLPECETIKIITAYLPNLKTKWWRGQVRQLAKLINLSTLLYDEFDNYVNLTYPALPTSQFDSVDVRRCDKSLFSSFPPGPWTLWSPRFCDQQQWQAKSMNTNYTNICTVQEGRPVHLWFALKMFEENVPKIW